MRKIIDSLVRNKKAFYLKAEGSSMLPLLRPGDILFLRKIEFQQVKVNDFVMAKNRKIILTHRVIYKNVNYLITKGDNNPQSDGEILPSQMIGKVYQIKRNGHIINLENFYLLQSTLYFQEIVKVKKDLDKERIDYVFLKGLPLHLYFEGSHPRRMYADCDVLVGNKAYEKSEKIFLRNGFRKVDASFSPLHRLLKDKPTEVSFVKKVHDFPVVFDMHFEPVFLMNQLGRLEGLYPPKLIDEMTEEFLKTKRRITVQNETFYILNTEYLILYLALHFFHHNFRGIHRLEMIDKVIRKDCDWTILEQKIKHFRIQNFVYPAFLMLKKYFDTPLPGGFLSSIKPEENKQRYNKKNIIKINVFDEDRRFQAGISRFKNIFFLSPEPMHRKLFVFFNPAVAYSIFWVLYKRFISFLKLSFWKVNPIKAP